jgi:uncharacterized membrane protein YqjE
MHSLAMVVVIILMHSLAMVVAIILMHSLAMVVAIILMPWPKYAKNLGPSESFD